MNSVLLINGPNLGLLGKRKTNIYGGESLSEIVQNLKKRALQNDLLLKDFQSNSEGELVTFLNDEYLLAVDGGERDISRLRGIIINPGAYTHTSIALHDALEVFVDIKIPIFEVHLSNIFAREEFRHKSYISSLATGVICGLGSSGYAAALERIVVG